MKPVIIIAIAVVFLFIPTNVFGEEIALKLELDNDNIKFGEQAFLKITPERFVPNTIFSFQITLQGENIENDPTYVKNIGFEGGVDNIYGFGWSSSSMESESGDYTLHVFYGYPDNYLGYNSIDFSFDFNHSERLQFIIDNYLPEKSDIGLSYTIGDVVAQGGCNLLTPCYDLKLERQYNSPSGYGVNVIYTKFLYFEDTVDLEKYSKYLQKTSEINSLHKQEDFQGFENFDCLHFGVERQYVLCNNTHMFFSLMANKRDHFDAEQQLIIFTEEIIRKINSNPIPISEKIHNTEKSTFATEYFESNEQEIIPLDDKKLQDDAVGLELTEKIPSWVKNIFGWYAQDQISEDELLNAIKYLINEKILVVN